jgi:hypothetical protein
MNYSTLYIHERVFCQLTSVIKFVDVQLWTVQQWMLFQNLLNTNWRITQQKAADIFSQIRFTKEMVFG